MRAALIVACLAAGTACGADDRPPTWDYVYGAIVRPNCATVACHTSGAAAEGINLETSAAAYVILTGRTCNDDPDLPQESVGSYVVPGDPTRSQLVRLLIGEDVARSMPPDRLLPMQDVELVEEWIAEGATCKQ
jgi:hypothetical protein